MARVPCLAILVALPAVASDVYVNGVNVEGLTNHTFEKVNVRLDEKGDVHIDAPGYTIKRVTVADAKKPSEPTAVMTQQYFLVTEQNVPGLTEYDVEVHLNGKYVRTVSSADPQLVAEISRFLTPGKNAVTLKARKRLENPEHPRSTAKAHVFRVIIGEGKVKADQVVIEKQVVTFVRTAHDTDDVTEEFSFTTR